MTDELGALSTQLAGSRTRDVRALCRLLPSSDRHSGPFPVAARAFATEDVDRSRSRCYRASDLAHSEAGDRNASRRCTGGRAILVVLLDNDSVLRDIAERYAAVGDALHGSSGAVYGLDADTFGRGQYACILLGSTDDLPFCEFTICEFSIVTVSTVLSSRPPTEPMDRP